MNMADASVGLKSNTFAHMMSTVVNRFFIERTGDEDGFVCRTAQFLYVAHDKVFPLARNTVIFTVRRV